MKAPDISRSEWFVMECLWVSSPQTASKVGEALRSSQGWAPNTVRTLLARLVNKSALKVGTNEVGTRVFGPAVSRKLVLKTRVICLQNEFWVVRQSRF